MDDQINFPLLAGLIGVYFFSVIFTVLQTRAASSERYKQYRLYTPVNDPLANTSKVPRTFSHHPFYRVYLDRVPHARIRLGHS